MTPRILPPNQLHHFYAGGPGIAALRGTASTDDNAPEDWVGSVTTMFGQAERGRSTLADGQRLIDALAADPVAWLGPAHAARRGGDPGLLVKLLDAGERLPVHAHPDRAFAARHLNCPYGKTEAWIIVATHDADAHVYLGFRDDVGADELRAWVDRQDAAAMLSALRRFAVRPGDTVLVPAGTPHAIGEGVLLVELQEPTDFSILMEWQGFDIDGAAVGHLGLGFDVALRAIDRSAWDDARLDAVRGDRPRPSDVPSGVRPLLPPAADAFFRAERVRPDPRTTLDAGYAVVVVLDGSGALRTEHGDTVALRRGLTAVVPHAAGAAEVTGDVHLLRCRPAAADAEVAHG